MGRRPRGYPLHPAGGLCAHCHVKRGGGVFVDEGRLGAVFGPCSLLVQPTHKGLLGGFEGLTRTGVRSLPLISLAARGRCAACAGTDWSVGLHAARTLYVRGLQPLTNGLIVCEYGSDRSGKTKQNKRCITRSSSRISEGGNKQQDCTYDAHMCRCSQAYYNMEGWLVVGGWLLGQRDGEGGHDGMNTSHAASNHDTFAMVGAAPVLGDIRPASAGRRHF